MSEQRARAKADAKSKKTALADLSVYSAFRAAGETVFLGYDALEAESAILGIIVDGVSVDRAVAAGRGVPTRALSIIVMLLLGVTVAVAVQIVGALLVLFLLVTPAAASLRVSSSPLVVPMLSVTFAVTASVALGYWVVVVDLDLDATLGSELRHDDLVRDLLENRGVRLATQTIVECAEVGGRDNVLQVCWLE